MQIEKMVELVIDSVKTYIDARLSKNAERFDVVVKERLHELLAGEELKSIIAALIPPPIPGKDGAPGRDGIDGKDGAPGIDGKDGPPGRDGLDGKDGAPGEPGRDGVDGKDGAPGVDGKEGPPGRDGVDGKDGAPGKDGADGPMGIQGPPGKDGVDGKDGAPGPVGPPGPPGRDGIDGKDGAPGPAGRDGVDGKDGAPGPAGRDGIDGKDGAPGEPGRDGIDGKDGEPGRDGRDGVDGAEGKEGPPGRDAAQLDILPHIDEEKVYARGTWARARGGLLRAHRTTAPLKSVGGDFENAGWEVMVNGISHLELQQIDERNFKMVIRSTNNDLQTLDLKVPGVLDRGVYDEATDYAKGDGVTYGGQWWIAQADGVKGEQPGTTKSWRLAVRRGKDGRDAGQSQTKMDQVKIK